MNEPETPRPFDVAVIGLSGRWPGAPGIDAFWRLLAAGVDAIRPFDDDELRRRGVDEARLRDPQFVKAGAVLDDVELFAASFFGYSPREAALLDPQQRIFLECAWEALEHAGYAPRHVPAQTGVFASCGLSTYLLFNLCRNAAVDEREEAFQAMIGTDKDFLATRVSYKLHLAGPSVTVQTGCSSSLVAVGQAVQSLVTWQCDVALAGGVAIAAPHRAGYWHVPGGIASPDGHCRPFSQDAAGTVFGDGVGIVVLKRLTDALADRDDIHAVIRGVAINNDGAAKLGYTAPSVAGQADVVRRALALADVAAGSISYVEAHGTATALGDPAEVLALTQAFREETDSRRFCAIGSVKGNIGHLDAAAGITGLIKTVLMLKHGVLVPSLHCGVANTRIDFEQGPFFVNTTCRLWETTGKTPRRAGVSSFGIGGTNAHAILEEAPTAAPRAGERRALQILPISASTRSALDAATDRLAEHLAAHPAIDLADAAFTLQRGRESMRYRRAVLGDRTDVIATRLQGRDREWMFDGDVTAQSRAVVLMFPGGAAQHAGMGHELYRAEPVFAAAVDDCAARLRPALGFDLRNVLTPSAERRADAARTLEGLTTALPAIFTVSYAMAALLASWGVTPAAMIGHSLGEYVAACLAGVLSLDDALDVVALRGRLIDTLPPGAMLSVYMSAADLTALDLPDVDVAAINAPDNCVIAGSAESIARAASVLEAREIECRRLRINAAAHSRAVEPIVEALRSCVRSIRLNPPATPYVSNLTGGWITNEQATDPEYWVRHLRQPVRFAEGVATLANQPDVVFVDAGPGRTLGSLVKTQLKSRAVPIVAMMKHANEDRGEMHAAAEGVAKLWLGGVNVDWQRYRASEECRRVALPTYPFERERYWIDRPAREHAAEDGVAPGVPACYLPGWGRTLAPRTAAIGETDRAASWVLCADDGGAIAEALRRRLHAAGARVVVVQHARGPRAVVGDERERETVQAASVEELAAVLRQSRQGDHPIRVVHLRTLSYDGAPRDLPFDEAQRAGLFSLVTLGQAAAQAAVDVDILVVTSGLEHVGDDGEASSPLGTLHAACVVLPQELDGLRCRLVDVGPIDDERSSPEEPLADRILGECAWDVAVAEPLAAWRGARRWSRRYDAVALAPGSARPWLRPGGVYLLVGGTGQIGATLAAALGRMTRCRLALTGRTGARRLDAPVAAAIAAAEAAGSEVAVFAANAADAPRMEEVAGEIERRWGPLAGVIHLAGTTGAAALQPVLDVTERDFDAHFEAKVRGLYVLQRLAAARRLDFCVSFSSTASLLGGVGMLPYAAGNAFVDAFAAERAAARGTRWISINWDGWLTAEGAPLASAALTRYAMPAEAAVDVLARIMSSTVSGQVVVSTAPLQARITEWTTQARPSRRGDRASTAGSAADADGDRVEGQARPELIADYVAPQTAGQKAVAAVWARVLGITRIGLDDNLFELGGNSLIALRLVAQLKRVTGLTVPVTTLFEAPTVRTLTRWIEERPRADERPSAADEKPAAPVDVMAEIIPPPSTPRRDEGHGMAIAIIGLSGRFPGADDVETLWARLVEGKESIRRRAGATSGSFVRASATLSDHESFDAAFFGMTPSEAMLRDPQHRLFLEQAWAALEHAGYDPRRYPHRVAVFGGATTNTYLTRHIVQRPDILAAYDPVQINVANGPDFLATLVSYKLNLTGPSHTVQSACSTSLVAVHQACQSLLSGECEMALAGGVSINLELVDGYRYIEGGILSADGYCRAFDEHATGTVFGSGVGFVVLKRLDAALADGDYVHAVIRGSAVNNDGGVKAGYTAPSVEGEARVIEDALRAAGVGADTIGYVECHGTGTRLGDPIELRALAKAYRAHTARRGFCAIGSVKTNVGHLDAAAGVTGLIKVVESLKHGTHVPSLHYSAPNPQFDLAASPFYVSARTQAWPASERPRRAGVSAFGVGGTNAHAIVEEAPARAASGPSRSAQLLVWSGRTRDAMDTAGQRLAAALRATDRPLGGVPLANRPLENPPLADVAYTLQTGKPRFAWRRAVVARDRLQAAAAVEAAVQRPASHEPPDERPPDDASAVVFVIGNADDAADAGARISQELYTGERVYREAIDRCAAALEAELGVDVRAVPVTEDGGETERRDTAWLTGSILFAHAYALARVWESWGVRPAAVLGSGEGEYAAACVAGVLTLDDAVSRLAARARHPRRELGAASPAEWRPDEPALVALRTAALDLLDGETKPVVVDIGFGARATMDTERLLGALGQAWTAGIDIDWNGFTAGERRHRVPLPTYPFQRIRYWIDAPASSSSASAAATASLATASAAPASPRSSAHQAELQPPHEPDTQAVRRQAPAIHAVPIVARGKRPALRNAYAPPRGAVEEAVVEIVEAALGIHPIGVTDRFGELGGDSLQAVRIVDAINTRLGCRLHVIDLYDDVTIRGLAPRLSGEGEPALVTERRE